MKIEILFPEMCNLFGDLKCMDFLAQCLPDAEFVHTSYTEEPLFVTETPTLIYMAPMTEKTQVKIIEKFLPYRDRLAELIDNGTAFLFIGNAVEVLGHYIELDDGSRLQALDVLPLWAKQEMMNRHNSKFVGGYEGETIVGFKSQFTMVYPDSDVFPLFTVEKGMGLNPAVNFEGIKTHNFFGSYVLGPLLILNPGFTKKLLQIMGIQNPVLAFETELTDAYQAMRRDLDARG